jgi:hydrogenase maturation protein HypF
LCADPQIKKFFKKNVFPFLNDSSNKVDFIILSEEMSIKKDYIDVPADFCPIFYIYSLDRLIPVTYSPFCYNKIAINHNGLKKQLLSFGYERDFTISYLQDERITVSPNFGELDNLYEIDAMDIMVNTIIGHSKFNNITVLKDYNNYSIISDYTRKFPSVKNVSHIYAHMSNVLFDNNIIDQKVIGIVYDNISYNDNDQIMGSEILYGKIGNIESIGGWKPLLLPGGDISNIEPWRIALAALKEVSKEGFKSIKLPLIENIRDNENYSYIFKAIDEGNLSYSLSSSMHHIIAALGEIISYKETTYNFEYFENMMDNSMIEKCSGNFYDIPIIEEDGKHLLDTYQLFRCVVDDLIAKAKPESLICNIIVSIAIATANLIDKLSKKYNEKKISLSGEYFKHSRILTIVNNELEKKGYKTYVPRNIPIDDSSISVGQLIYYYYSNH